MAAALERFETFFPNSSARMRATGLGFGTAMLFSQACAGGLHVWAKNRGVPLDTPPEISAVSRLKRVISMRQCWRQS